MDSWQTKAKSRGACSLDPLALRWTPRAPLKAPRSDRHGEQLAALKRNIHPLHPATSYLKWSFCTLTGWFLSSPIYFPSFQVDAAQPKNPVSRRPLAWMAVARKCHIKRHVFLDNGQVYARASFLCRLLSLSLFSRLVGIGIHTKRLRSTNDLTTTIAACIVYTYRNTY